MQKRIFFIWAQPIQITNEWEDYPERHADL